MSGVSHPRGGGGAAVVAVSVETAFFPMLVALNINCLCQTNSTISTIGVAPGLIGILGFSFFARVFLAGWDLDARPKVS